MKQILFSLCCVLAAAAATTASAQEGTALTATDINNYTTTASHRLAGIHDPSIVQAGSQFYIMGSHQGFAQSANLMDWSSLNMRFAKVNADGTTSSCSFEKAFSTQQVTSVKAIVNGQKQDVTFGNFDAEAWAHADDASYNISGNLWAPDIIYNPRMKKWCMYMSVNGPAWHSVIVLLTSNTIAGEYVYQGPVTFSGFINGTDPAISWKKTDLEIAIGQQTSLPSRYNKGSEWGWHWPNNIDPCVFYDADSTLWMTYGSWSGGIFMLQLDPETGLRDYTVEYPLTTVWGDHASSDPYFGKRIAGGDYVSGEGSYIQRIGDYYYLFMSYGGLESNGGYVMRMFRSKNPDGPYVDTRGNAATFDRYALNFGANAADNRGHLLMSAYKDWGFQTEGEGRQAQGHNSAIVDDRGRAFVVYHSRYDNGTEWFHDRVQQLFQNRQGWLVCVPFEYNGETLTQEDIEAGCLFTAEEIAGTYSILLHRYKLDNTQREAAAPVSVTLTADGKVTGSMTGTWRMTEGTGYITLVLDNVNYQGVVTEQTIEGTTANAVCISALAAASGQPVWAYKMEPKYAVAYTAKAYELPVKNNASISRNLSLHATQGLYGASISWMSSEPDVISPTGLYNPADTVTEVTLTCRIAAGDFYYDQTRTVKAARNTIDYDTRMALLTPLVAYYDFEQGITTTTNRLDETQKMYFSKGSSGTRPELSTLGMGRDGQIALFFPGATSAKASFAYCTNPLHGRDLSGGFTISIWLRADTEDAAGLTLPLWSLTDKRGNMATLDKTLYLTPNATVGFSDANDYFYANKLDESTGKGTGYIASNEWAFVTFTCDSTGTAVYVNGAKKMMKTFESSAGTAKTASAAAALFDYSKVLDMVATAQYLNLGTGVKGVGTPLFGADDLLVHQRALTGSEATSLYRLATRVTDFTSAIAAPAATSITHPADGAVRDILGRRVPATYSLRPGIYIIDGRKVVIR